MYKIRLLGLFLILIVALFLTANTTGMENYQRHCYAIIAPIEEGRNGTFKVVKNEFLIRLQIQYFR